MFNSVSCSLILRGHNLNFEEINKNLHLKPTNVIRKGQVISKVIGESELDAWIYKLKFKEKGKINEFIEKFLKIIKPKADYIKDLPNVEDASLKFYIQSDLAQIAFEISPILIKELSKLNLRLEISIFSWGGAEDK